MPDGYDTTGVHADNCVIRNAMQWIVDNSPAGSGYLGLEFPAGKTRLLGGGYTAAISTLVTSTDGNGVQYTARIPMRARRQGQPCCSQTQEPKAF